MQQSAQTTQALALVGATVVVNGTTAQLANGQASWTLNATKPATATDHHHGAIRPDRLYRHLHGQFRRPNLHLGRPRQRRHAVAGRHLYPDRDAASTPAASPPPISTQVQGTVNSVDLTQTPPLLSIDGQNYTINQIQQIVAPGS